MVRIALLDPKYDRLREMVQSYYEQPHRVYHNWKHIWQGFVAVNSTPLTLSLAQEIAWVFHDIVHIPNCPYNEKNSVHLMYQLIKAYEFRNGSILPKEAVQEAETYIRCTEFHTPVCEDSKLIIDMDFSVFADLTLLRESNAAIEQEYCLTDNTPRIAFLKTLQTKQLYHTEYARAHWEDRAKQNLRTCIAEMEQKNASRN